MNYPSKFNPSYIPPSLLSFDSQGLKGFPGEPGYRGPPGLNGTFYGHGIDGEKGEGIILLKWKYNTDFLSVNENEVFLSLKFILLSKCFLYSSDFSHALLFYGHFLSFLKKKNYLAAVQSYYSTENEDFDILWRVMYHA